MSSVQLTSIDSPFGSLEACVSGDAAGVGKEAGTVGANPGLMKSGGGLAHAKSRYTPRIFRIPLESCET